MLITHNSFSLTSSIITPQKLIRSCERTKRLSITFFYFPIQSSSTMWQLNVKEVKTYVHNIVESDLHGPETGVFSSWSAILYACLSHCLIRIQIPCFKKKLQGLPISDLILILYSTFPQIFKQYSLKITLPEADKMSGPKMSMI